MPAWSCQHPAHLDLFLKHLQYPLHPASKELMPLPNFPQLLCNHLGS